MKTPGEWETWCYEFWLREKRYPWWAELIEAVQQDARDNPPKAERRDARPGATA